ncbi:VOC family protein [Salinadaptatus halalkaliphilus]|uniref:VOC family protein n=1 Tax=Salinadaptatus halalkaliphilus TaxID=2419781 RepID=A0A4S3TIA1_9EURY|nr:VOC family protein [Salinadaptatus halalkaliphilus]THE63671.1 VOC family protein [Salinadaptatus halalkaliphilus]
MSFRIDHVPFAFDDLETISDEFERLGLTPEYGGVHGNGVTHMSVLGFEDQSYVELIARRTDGDHGYWPDHIRENAGPAAWCVRVPDVRAECKRLLERGVVIRGPVPGSRKREDGTLVEWDRAEFGTEDQRLLFPFAITDRTPLSYRVDPSPSVSDEPLTGVGQVVVAVDDLEAAVDTFRRCYDIPTPVRETVPGFGTVASIPGQPLAFATPTDDGWLADRLEQFPDGPCSCLLATEDLERAREQYPLEAPTAWPDGRIALFESELLGHRLGVVERPR